MEVDLRLTCEACPEQYDAYLGGEMVGYLRLRHGSFTVECPDCFGELVFEARPAGDGVFDVDERERYLDLAKTAILGWVARRSSGSLEREDESVEAWRRDVAEGQTLLGYDSWVRRRR